MAQLLYGTAFYHEYMPGERLEKDIALMKGARLNVVRLGESTWSLWEPADGVFEFAWMDRVVDAMHAAGIRVILGTPTYSIPVWMYRKHPDMLARPLGGQAPSYGLRQNMDIDNADYRFYCARIIEKLVARYRDHPAVIAWQIDNETGGYGAANPDVFAGFIEHLKSKFHGDLAALNRAWFLNYWGQTIARWEDFPTRDSATSTSYKLEWARWQHVRVTRFLAWQGDLVRRHRRPDQFIFQDYGGNLRKDVNHFEVARHLDVAAVNSYHDAQDRMNGEQPALDGDFTRSLLRTNFLVSETNAQSTDWSSACQYPPYDGQMRLHFYAHLAGGANAVMYWHWHSIHAGQETYWKGVLSHDLEPNRAYAEVCRIGAEAARLGPKLVDMRVENEVAILYSNDSLAGLDFMPFALADPWGKPNDPALFDYGALVRQFHRGLFRLNVGVDFVFPEAADFSRYKVLIVPALYVADEALLRKIEAFVRAGGHVVATFKSGFADEHSAARAERAPGPLRAAAGFSYQEFSSLRAPLALRDDPFGVGADNQVNHWAEFLQLEGAEAIAWYDHPFFGRWPALTCHRFVRGTFTYEGTCLSQALQNAVLRRVLGEAGMDLAAADLPPPVRLRRGTNQEGRALWYYLNFSAQEQHFTHGGPAGIELLGALPVATGSPLALAPWEVAIIEQTPEAATASH